MACFGEQPIAIALPGQGSIAQLLRVVSLRLLS